MYVALDTFPHIDYFTDIHIDKWRKIKENERPQSIFVTTYTETGLTTQNENFS